MSNILSELYLNKQVDDCIAKLVPSHLRDDFKQELFLILMGKEDSVLRAHAEGKHLFYAVRIIVNLAYQSRNVYRKEYLRREIVELPDNISVPCEESFPYEIRKFKEDREDRLIKKIQDSEAELDTPYYRLLAEALQKHGSAGKVAKATGIPKSSVQVGIKKIRKYLNDGNITGLLWCVCFCLYSWG